MAIKPHKNDENFIFALNCNFKEMQFELSCLFDLIFMGFYYHMITTKTLRSYLTFAKQALKIKGSIFFLKKKSDLDLKSGCP